MLTIYKASAGSGKTYNLTRDYIRYLLAEKKDDGSYRLRREARSRHSHILAITFTNKATAEMSERIVKALALLSGLTVEGTTGSPYEKDFIREFGCTAEELRRAAGRALKDLLFDYAYFNVSTIDSFFQSVLRLFTREVELPDNFAVDLDNTRAITIGLGELLNSIKHPADPDPRTAESDRWLQSWLLEFMEAEMKDGKVFNLFLTSSRMFADMVESFRNLMNETFKRNIDKIREYYSDAGRIVKLRNRLASISGERYTALRSACRRLLDTGVEPEWLATTMRSHIRDWMRGKNETDWNATMDKVAADPTAAFLSDSTLKKSGLRRADIVTPERLEAIEAVMEAAARCREYDSTLRPIALNIFTLGLLGRILDNVSAYCRDNNLVLLSETNSILKGIINNDETPFLYEKLGYQLNHYLIDEFQDTSVMQWDNLKPLLLESLSRGNDNLVIGDEKQSIYRFRNADPELLGHLVADDVTANRYWVDAAIQSRGQELSENSNWRSSQEVVRFNNTVFHYLPRLLDRKNGIAPGAPRPITATYRGIIQQIAPARLEKITPGYVRIEFIPAAGRNSDEMTDSDPRMEFIERQLRRLFTEGKYRASDIAILVRSNVAASNVISHLLAAMERTDNPLPRFAIMNNEAMTLGSSKAVQLIVSILRLVNLPEFLDPDPEEGPDGKPRVTNAYRRLKLFNRYHYYLHSEHPATDDEPARPFTPAEALQAAVTHIDDSDITGYKSLLDMECLNLPGVVERIIARFVPAATRDDEAIFLSAFQDAVLDYCARGDHDIRRFMQWWDSAGRKIGVSSPADLDAVKVMTIHQSKGLEFPCVILPLSDRSLSRVNGGRPEWIPLDREGIGETFDIDTDLLPELAPIRMCTEMKASPFLRESLDEHIIRESIDELNVQYVAFTRASRELLVCAPLPDKYKTSSAIGAMLSDVIQSTDDAALASGDDRPDGESAEWTVGLADKLSGQVFTYGSPTVREAEESDKKTDDTAFVTIDRYTLLSPENDKLSRDPDPDERPVLRAKIEAIDPFDPSEPRHIGIFLHNVLSLVTTRDKLDSALKRMFYRYRIPADMRPGLTARLRMALSEPAAARWFEGFERVITERSLSWETDGRIITNRPDRIVVMPDGSIEIVDYKFVTTLPGEEWTDRRYRKYRDQIHDYTYHLHDATDAPVRGYLWFISDTATQIVPII